MGRRMYRGRSVGKKLRERWEAEIQNGGHLIAAPAPDYLISGQPFLRPFFTFVFYVHMKSDITKYL